MEATGLEAVNGVREGCNFQHNSLSTKHSAQGYHSMHFDIVDPVAVPVEVAWHFPRSRLGVKDLMAVSIES